MKSDLHAISRLRRVALIVTAVLMSACTTSTKALRPEDATTVPSAQIMASEYLQPSASRTVPVILIREKGYIGSKMGTVAVVDEKPVALLLRKQKLLVYLAPGEHVFAMGYAKHLETRPLTQASIKVMANQPLVVSFRLFLGQEPEIVALSSEQASAIPSEHVLKVCDTAFNAGGPAYCDVDSSGAVWSDGTICANVCARAHLPRTEPSWSDLGNLEEYADPNDIAGIIDGAIEKASRRDWMRGNVGRAMNPKHRYVYTRVKGWIDLKHVISTTSNPGAYIPGASWLASYGVEVAQVFVAPMSAFLEEDEVSNSIGAWAALRYFVTLGRKGTRGEIAQAKIFSLHPMTRDEALSEFGIAVARFDLTENGAPH
ncbi:MAG: hypothetical protein AB7E72_13680 [Lysobacterales bacterium]